MYLRFGYIVNVLSTRGQAQDDINVQVKLVENDEPVFARLINSYNSIYSPEDKTPCIVGCVNDKDNLWAWAINGDDVMRILQGEKVIFDSAGNKVYLKKDSGILIQTAKGNIDITSAGDINIVGNINIAGNVNITGNLDVSGTSDLVGATTIQTKPFITHIHSGVQSGVNNSGGVV
jgi:phage baseplate assembly protein V